ncbi:MAG: TetR/AcrR family transcriptional regulator [Bacteroidales bacterium]|nr:TetR/AcrR family transcriptional regulator [Bacteroidales bacterium]
MYHIANDKRQQATAEKIRQALIHCLSVKTMSEITVSDISTAAGVSRSTFYRSFDIPLDVLRYECDRVVVIMENDYAGAKLKNLDDLVHFTLRYWKNHSEVLDAAVNCDRMDIVHKSISSRSEKLLSSLEGIIGSGFSEQEIDYIRMGAIGLISNLLSVWIKHGKKESPEQLFDLYLKFTKMIRAIRE